MKTTRRVNCLKRIPRLSMTNEHMRYLGCLRLLEECSPHVDEEIRECIECAFEEAVTASNGTLRTRRVMDRICIEIVIPRSATAAESEGR